MNSISNIQYFKSCPLSYKLYTIVGLRKIEDETADHHLIFGSAYHKAMEVIYKAQQQRAELSRIIGDSFVSRDNWKHCVVEKAKGAFRVAYPRQLDESDNAKTQESGCAAIESYYDTYAEEDRRRWKVLAVEAPAQYDSGFVVHLDMVAEDLDHGGIYGFDFKTTKKALDYSYFGKFEPNSQITRYVDYIRETYGSCEGFYIRATRFGYRSRMYKGEPAGFYVQHEAQLFNVNTAQIEIEKKSAAYWQDAIVHASVTGSFGTNTDHCTFCPYRPICKAGWTWEQDRELILNQYRLVCGETTESLRACLLDPGHEGEHSERAPHGAESMNIEVDV